MSKMIFRNKEEYRTPWCEIESVETEDFIAGSPLDSPDDVPPSDEEDWGDF